MSAFALTAPAQNFSLINQSLANPDNEPAPVHPIPHDRQVKWNETEFYAFFHYGMNTFTGLEWGNGDEDEARYAP
ncbi:MAG: carbohydrate-binding protein, partial [Muribaculaceae bacterium]|nr:carbohydrate-binding protein [Muribaculaceae bacterium]